MIRGIERFAALTGAVFAVLVFLSFVIEGEPPDLDGPVEEVVAFYVDNDTDVLIASVLATLATVMLIFFAASVRRTMREHEGEGGVLSAAAFGGGIVAAAGIGVDSAIRFALAESADDVSPDALQALFAVWSNFFWPIVAGMATLILALGLSALSTRVIPPWLAWIGFLIAILLFTPAGFFAVLAVLAWTLIVSILLWRYDVAAVSTRSP